MNSMLCCPFTEAIDLRSRACRKGEMLQRSGCFPSRKGIDIEARATTFPTSDSFGRCFFLKAEELYEEPIEEPRGGPRVTQPDSYVMND